MFGATLVGGYSLISYYAQYSARVTLLVSLKADSTFFILLHVLRHINRDGRMPFDV